MSKFLIKMRHFAENRASSLTASYPKKPHIPDFCSLFVNTTLPVIIAEIKFSSPTQPQLYQGTKNFLQIAQSYLQAGAHALSVLTEPNIFKGDIEFIRNITTVHPQAIVLLKDFVVHPKQIDQAASVGASGVLLMVSLLNQVELQRLYEYCLELGVTPLLEVHSHDELDRALLLDPKIILVNQRNLHDLTIHHQIAQELISSIPCSIHAICASAITHLQEIQQLHAKGYSGFLIGSHLMRQADPGVALTQMLKGEHHES